MFVSPQILMLRPYPAVGWCLQVGSWVGWGEVMRVGPWTVGLRKRTCDGTASWQPPPSQERRPQNETNTAGTVMSWLPSSRTMRNKRLLFKPLVCGVWLQQPLCTRGAFREWEELRRKWVNSAIALRTVGKRSLGIPQVVLGEGHIVGFSSSFCVGRTEMRAALRCGSDPGWLGPIVREVTVLPGLSPEKAAWLPASLTQQSASWDVCCMWGVGFQGRSQPAVVRAPFRRWSGIVRVSAVSQKQGDAGQTCLERPAIQLKWG